MDLQGGGLRPNRGALFQLDTVRALHQTIVSLRTALEVSKSELDDLRNKYETHIDTIDYSDTIKKLTLENHVLRRKLIGEEDFVPDQTKVNVENENFTTSEKQPKLVTFALDSDVNEIKSEDVNVENVCDSVQQVSNELDGGISILTNLSNIDEVVSDDKQDKSENKSENDKNFNNEKTNSKGEFETTLELESKFDVTIKVCTVDDYSKLKPIEIETSDTLNILSNKVNISKETFENSSESFIGSNPPLHTTITIASNEEINMAGSRETNNNFQKGNDKLNIQVKITSEENLVMDQCSERESASEHLNVEPDEISARSVSEGENSVFSEAGGTITNVSGSGRRVCEQDSISGNDSEEVDDIELIFTTDETKEFSNYQEDLVSITDGENWVHGDVSTPVLVKFNVLDPDLHKSKFENSDDNIQTENDEANIMKNNGKESSKNYETSTKTQVTDEHGFHKKGVLKHNTKNYLETSNSKQDGKSFESTDSFSFDNKSYSFDNTKSSSMDRGSSIDIVTRDLSFDQKEESLDQLDALRTTMRTHYTVCVETDISKCGVMEDDAFPCNLNLRRNTCPNPFQYRPLSHRDAVKSFHARPLMGSGIKGPRRSSAAQTDISALPNHWRSDTHLAKKALPTSILTTLPSKVSTRGMGLTRLAPPVPMRPTHLSQESRRVLLSDIGFTSMVPELSRSAEPVWGALGASVLTPTSSVARLPYCCALHAANCFGSVPSSPTRQDSSNTNSKYWSKSSMQRSISGRMGETTPGSHRVSFIDKPMRGGWRGSMPELRKSITCCSASGFRSQKMNHFSGATRSRTMEGGDSGDSTEELLDEAERFLRSSVDCMAFTKPNQDEWCPSPCSRPYLPSVPRQLRLGHLVKVIAPHGRIALGKVRYVGIAGGPAATGVTEPTYVGIQLKKTMGTGGGDGTFHGRRYFYCEPGCSLFVPFSKVVVAWADI